MERPKSQKPVKQKVRKTKTRIDPRKRKVADREKKTRVDPRKRRVPGRKIVIRRDDDPWTDAELDRLVEEAIRFIEQAHIKWGTHLGLSVGEWLYVKLFKANDEYLRSQNPYKTRSLNKIARRTQYSSRTLRTWLWAGRMKVHLEQAGFSSERLMLTDWAALYELRERPEAALQVAEWIHQDNPSVEMVWQYVDRWKNQHGNRPPPKPTPPPKPNPRPRRRPDEMRQLRCLRLVLRWVKEARFSRVNRKRLLVKVRQLRDLIEERV